MPRNTRKRGRGPSEAPDQGDAEAVDNAGAGDAAAHAVAGAASPGAADPGEGDAEAVVDAAHAVAAVGDVVFEGLAALGEYDDM